MNYEKVLLAVVAVIVVILIVLGGFNYFGYQKLKSVIGSSVTDLDHIIELERTIYAYDKSIADLELRENDIRIRENEIDIRKGTIELREEKLNTRSIEITRGEKDLVNRKRELEENSRSKLIELIGEIEESRKLVESLKDNIANIDNSINTGNN